MANVRFPFNHFEIKSPEEFRQKMAHAGYEIPVSGDLRPLQGSFIVNGRRIENSMAVQPLEGLDGREDGSPSELTLARHEKLAAQGAGILWVEATAVVPEGRDSLRQLWLHAGSLDGFRALVRTIDEAAAKAGHALPYKILQLTHSGRCSVDAAGRPAPVAAFHSPYLDPTMGTPQIVTDEYLDQLQAKVAEAAALAEEAGFDAVELKLCHQYLFKELLCAYTRPGRYGGSQENRFRFALGAIDQIRRRLGGKTDIVVRLNAYDGIPWPYGWGMQAQSNTTASVGTKTSSNWSGNPLYQQLTAEGASNWSGNPSPLTISEAEKSNWSGNLKFEKGADPQYGSWQGNTAFQQGTNMNKSNWSGNPSPLEISDEEKSSWQGNPHRESVDGTAPSNWPGNPDFVPAACAACKDSQTTNATLTISPAPGATYTVPLTPGASYSIPPMPGAANSTPSVPGAADTAAPTPGPMQIDLTEVKELMRQLYRRGIRIFNLTTTSPRFAPTGNGYLDNFSATAEVDPFAGTAALLHATKELRQGMSADVRIVGTGLSWFGPFSANVAAGGISKGWFDIAGFGRGVMADNNFIPAILQSRQPDPAKACIGCDNCFKLFFAGLPTGCPMQHAAYQDLFQHLQLSRGGTIIY